MESKRQSQVAEAIRRNFGYVLQQEGSYIYGDQAFVTVTSVRMSPDLLLAKIYLSIYNIEDKNSIVMLMDQHKSSLKHALVTRIRKHLRRMPDIEFYLDDTLDEMYKLNHIFDNLNNKN